MHFHEIQEFHGRRISLIKLQKERPSILPSMELVKKTVLRLDLFETH